MKTEETFVDPTVLSWVGTDGPRQWQELAVCSGRGNELFYGDSDHFVESPTSANPDAARLCGRCSVSDECLAFALENNERHGIWGGMTPSQRTAYKKRRRRERVVAASEG